MSPLTACPACPTAQGAGHPGERIVLLRRRLGLTMDALAVRAGVALATVRRIEHGQGIQQAKLAALAEALGVSVAYLYTPIV